VIILGIETSCDETAAAVVVDGKEIRSSVVASQVDLHARFGGVVPEIASRAHLELVNGVIGDALVEAGIGFADVDAVAATRGPGLAGALLVGVSAAKAVALARGIPYIGVNHLEGHLHAAWLQNPQVELPLAVLLVSGGHTMLVAVHGDAQYRVLGETVDDAAGEAFDKVARLLGLGYPGGPVIDRLAREGNPKAIRFPRPMEGDGLEFSFSGLKTAVLHHVRRHPDDDVADVAASFQAAVVDVLTSKLDAAADTISARTLVLGGGVAANSELRRSVAAMAAETGRTALIPPPELCTDNAAMIAATAWWRYRSDGPSSLGDGAFPSLALPSEG
jgi:putative glycoprotease GCP